MNRIVLFCLGFSFILSFKVFAFDAPGGLKINGTASVSGLNQPEMIPVRFQERTSIQSFSTPQKVEEQENLLTELTIYGLIILVYWLYWLNNKPVN